MRKPFRTTLDEDLLVRLKKMAVEKGVNVNDIIEFMVCDRLRQDYFTKNAKDFPTMTLEKKNLVLERRLSQVIRDVIFEFDLNETPPNLSEIIARTIASILLSDELIPK